MKPPRERGSAAVEFALVAPLFFLAVAGIVETANFMFVRAALSPLVARAARCAAIGKPECATAAGTVATIDASARAIPLTVFIDTTQAQLTTEDCGRKLRIIVRRRMLFAPAIRRVFELSACA